MSNKPGANVEPKNVSKSSDAPTPLQPTIPSSEKANLAHRDVPEIVFVTSDPQGLTNDSPSHILMIPSPNLSLHGNESDEPPPKPPKEVKKKPKVMKPGQIYCDEDRIKWEGKYNCLLSMVGFAVGLSNVWRFPYLCFEHGGGAFLIPYFFFIFACAIPVISLEVIVGQFTQSGMISVWKLVPICRGVGICQAIMPFLIAFYYQVILAWAMLYCVESLFRHKVPWVGCIHPWNTLHCRDIPPDFEKITVGVDDLRAGAEFFRGRVQRKWKSMFVEEDNVTSRSGNGGTPTFGLGPMDLGVGPPNLDVSLYLLAIFIVILFLLSRGLRIKGSSLWILIVAPYIMMLVLLYRGLALPGAWAGVRFLFEPHRTKLFEFKTWRAAAEQTFFSCGAGTAIHLTFASHNQFNHNMIRDAVATAMINSLTSLIFGVIVFMCLGSIAFSDSVPITELVAHGPDLVFEVCADALGRIPGANFYSFIFFLMIFIVGLETSYGSLVCIQQSFFDVAGDWFDRNGNTRGLFVKVMLVIAYAVSLTCATRGGLHMFIFLDTFTSVEPLLLCAFILVVSLTWIYGLHEICDAAEVMIGKRPNVYFQVCWKFISPAVILVVFVFSIYDTTGAKYVEGVGAKMKTVLFSNRFQYVGRIYSHLPSIAIPIGVIWYWFSSPGRTCKEKWLLGISPEHEHEQILETGQAKRTSLKHYLYGTDVPHMIQYLRKFTLTKVHPEENVEIRDNGNVDQEEPLPPSKPSQESVEKLYRSMVENNDEELLPLIFNVSTESFRTQVHKLSF